VAFPRGIEERAGGSALVRASWHPNADTWRQPSRAEALKLNISSWEAVGLEGAITKWPRAALTGSWLKLPHFNLPIAIYLRVSVFAVKLTKQRHALAVRAARHRVSHRVLAR
jgi:hypothetical protein